MTDRSRAKKVIDSRALPEPGETSSQSSGDILVVDDDFDFAGSLADLLQQSGYATRTAESAQQARRLVGEFAPAVALVDIQLGSTSGLDLVAELARTHPELICVMVTARAELDTAIEAIRQGAYDYLRKPVHGREVLALLDRCFEKLRLEREKRAAEEALSENEKLLTDAIESSPDGVAIYDADDRLVIHNDKFRTGVLSGIADLIQPGARFEDLVRAAVDRGLVHVPDGDAEKYVRDRVAHHRGAEGNLEIKLANDRWMLSRERRMRNGGIIGTRTNITKRKRIEEAFKAKSAEFQSILDHAPAMIFLKDAEGRYLMANRAFEQNFNITEKETIGKLPADILSADLAESSATHDNDVIRTRQASAKEETFLFEGEERTLHTVKFPILNGAGELSGIGAIATDITERKGIERALRESEERLGEALRIARLGNWEFDKVSGKSWWSDEGCRILGLAPGTEFVPFETFRSCVHPDDVEHSLPTLDEIGAIGSRKKIEYRVVWPDGSIHDVEEHLEPVLDNQGNYVKIRGTIQDITDRKRLEELLRQSQKMEAVGHLTGGVAHDFNNLLTVILGNLDLLRDHVATDPAGQELIDTAIKASERGADLTQRLLAFSRKQALDPRVTEVNRLISDSIELLRRTLGENIEIEAVLDDDLWKAMVDSKQLENAILNLALNARDAMPGGGRLTIATANIQLDREFADTHDEVRRGRYVLIEVSDTGAGMPAEVLGRAFDPFFTTKEVGQGSGLGLSMVYGFAKQSDGHVAIHSEAGHGTTVKLYLPRAMSVERAIDDEPGRQSPLPKGSETLLVVEDDADVRAFITAALRSVGYGVIEAADGESALALADETPDIGLLITDVILPHGMNGREVADGVRKRRPGTKVLFTSGYARNVIVHQGKLDEGVELLRKPYTRDTLAHRVRQILDAPKAGPRSDG